MPGSCRGKRTIRSRGIAAFISIMGPGALLLFGVPSLCKGCSWQRR